MFILIILIALQYYVLAEDPAVKMTPIEIIKYWGYEGQNIEVTTADGYKLNMHRIPQGKHLPKNQTRPVVFLQHGLLSSSADWVSNLPYQSAGFMFADAGFDVFMGNVRGNTYSTGHISLNSNSREYWKFSWDEMVKYDLDAMIDKALQITGQKYIYYIGHSQGTLIMFSKLSLNTTFSQKIRQFHALAPIGTVGHLKGPLYEISKLLNHQEMLLNIILGGKNFMSNKWIDNEISRTFCALPIFRDVCKDIFILFTGKNSEQLNISRFDVFLGHFPADTSLKNMNHWIQMVNSNKQQMYDYGSRYLNMKYYGQPRPPIYNISNVNVATYLHWSKSDYLANSKDVINSLVKKLKRSSLKGNFEYKDFNHLDFIWGLRAAPEIYNNILLNIKNDIKDN
uniref:Lipase n=1 Tax=Strongyloides papillosus TaxID=174720 RepID=A0A0N5CCP0_STREA